MCGEKEMQPAGDLCWGAAVTRRVKKEKKTVRTVAERQPKMIAPLHIITIDPTT